MKKFLFIACLFFQSTFSQAQSVGVGTSSPDSSAVLELNSSAKGFLPPRLTQAQRNKIYKPATGLVIWCANCGSTGELEVYNGTGWTNACGGTVAPAPISEGDTAMGGWVFYILKEGDPGYISGETHGLIAAMQDISVTAGWGCTGVIINNINTGLFSGQSNTTNILAACTETASAAAYCNDLVSNSYSDWYLPSRDELQLLYQNLHVKGSGTFNTSIPYWSSSQNSGNTAWYVRFTDGHYDYNGKSVLYNVRAIRKF